MVHDMVEGEKVMDIMGVHGKLDTFFTRSFTMKNLYILTDIDIRCSDNTLNTAFVKKKLSVQKKLPILSYHKIVHAMLPLL